jgi:hypothetical protein
MNRAVKDTKMAQYIRILQASIFSEGKLWIGYQIFPEYWWCGFGYQSVSWLMKILQSRFPEKKFTLQSILVISYRSTC